MSSESQSEGTQGTAPVIVEDLFVTDTFLIKGRMAGKYQRLSKMLEDLGDAFLTVDDAVMISLRGTDVVRTPNVQINTRELVFAHELVDVAGDDLMRVLASDEKNVRIRAFYNGSVQLELAGMVEPGAYAPDSGQSRRYFVMADPVIRGLNLEASSELRLLKSLSYAIVQKARLSYVYDFS